MKDSYSELLGIMKENGAAYNPPSLEIGIVLNENTLKVGDLQLTKDDFYIADYLKKYYVKQFEVDGVTKSYTSKDYLKSGDIVAVLATEDKQKYIVLAKVVAP